MAIASSYTDNQFKICSVVWSDQALPWVFDWDNFLSRCKKLLGEGKVEEFLQVMGYCNDSLLFEFQIDLKNLKIRWNALPDNRTEQEINGIRAASLDLVERITKKIHLLNKSTTKSPSFYPDKKIIELMIVGNKINMTAIAWHELLVNIAKSVGRITVGGTVRGTGFLLEGGYLLTANHVIPDAKAATTASVEFNVETGVSGEMKPAISYLLDPKSAIFNPVNQLNFTYIEVTDNPQYPLSQWGYLQIENEIEIQASDALVLIHHPNGGTKQISLEPEGVLGIQKAENQFFYKNDTAPGSSGAPVLNSLLHLVGIHLGKKDDKGNNNTGNQSANYAVDIAAVMRSIAEEERDQEISDANSLGASEA